MPIKKSRYAEEQTAFALMQADMGTPVAEVVRKMGVTRSSKMRKSITTLCQMLFIKPEFSVD